MIGIQILGVAALSIVSALLSLATAQAVLSVIISLLFERRDQG